MEVTKKRVTAESLTAIKAAPELYKLFMILRYYEGMNDDEIAQALNVGPYMIRQCDEYIDSFIESAKQPGTF